MTLEPEVAGPQSEEAVTARPTPTSAPPVFAAAQGALLRCILNRIVPAHDDLPGAGDLQVGDSIERTLAGSPRLRRLFLDGLREIEIAAGFTPEFVDLDAASQTGVLERVEQRAPAFFVALVEHAYRGYYALAAVQVAVGFDARPPQPLGHTLPPFDPAVLDQQRQRAPFWRRTS
jgi:hypothetical protein